MRLFYGKPVSIAVTIIGLAAAGYSMYWLGRSDEVKEIIDIVEEQGSTTLKFYNHETKTFSKIAMTSIPS